MMANRLVALDKEPGTRPVGIGEMYRRLWAKCLLKAIGSQATLTTLVVVHPLPDSTVWHEIMVCRYTTHY